MKRSTLCHGELEERLLSIRIDSSATTRDDLDTETLGIVVVIIVTFFGRFGSSFRGERHFEWKEGSQAIQLEAKAKAKQREASNAG